MTDPSVDPGILSKAVDWLWAGVLALVGIIYKVNDRKHDAAEKQIKDISDRIDYEVRCMRVELKSKAEQDDIKKALCHIETLFEKAEKDRELTRDRFDALNQRMTDTHIILLDKIAELPNICPKP